jgi:hemolysin III
MIRTRLRERVLPDYTHGEELFNMISHIVGGGLGVLTLICCLYHSWGDGWGMTASLIYGISFIQLYTISSVYHGLRTNYSKKVMQIIDHCTIYFLIAGTYTVILLSALRPEYPQTAWGIFFFEWALTALAVTLTAIDLKKYSVFSMVCYIGMGWAIIPFWRQVLDVLGPWGFGLLLAGGIAYTIGSVLYGLGKKKKWMHSVFHIFVVLGSILQFFSVLFFAL